MKILSVILLGSTILTGCASTQNLKEGSSILGGVSEDQLRPGLYVMSALGSLVPFDTARANWGKRADQLCGKDQYQEINLTTHQSPVGSGAIIAASPGMFAPISPSRNSLNGYILCNSSPINKNEAIEFIKSLPNLHKQALEENFRTELANLGGANCLTASDKDSGENYYRRGKILIAQSQYNSALVCFQKTVAYGPDLLEYKDACAAIGEIYELGFGVPANIDVAKEWYLKAGLL